MNRHIRKGRKLLERAKAGEDVYRRVARWDRSCRRAVKGDERFGPREEVVECPRSQERVVLLIDAKLHRLHEIWGR